MVKAYEAYVAFHNVRIVKLFHTVTMIKNSTNKQNINVSTVLLQCVLSSIINELFTTFVQ